VSAGTKLQLTETDYRAVLAFLWTILTFAIIFYLIYKGGAIQDVASIAGLFLPLDAVFIQSYFKSKE